MKITIYELIGLVKDGKQPKKIKYKGQEYTFFDDEIIDYSFKDDNDINGWLSTHIGNEYIGDMFTNTVEIIEEPKKIEKLDVELLGQEDNWLRNPTTEITKQDIELNPYIIDTIRKNTLEFQHRINELIDEINNLKEK